MGTTPEAKFVKGTYAHPPAATIRTFSDPSLNRQISIDSRWHSRVHPLTLSSWASNADVTLSLCTPTTPGDLPLRCHLPSATCMYIWVSFVETIQPANTKKRTIASGAICKASLIAVFRICGTPRSVTGGTRWHGNAIMMQASTSTSTVGLPVGPKILKRHPLTAWRDGQACLQYM